MLIIRCVAECALVITFGSSINKAKWARKFKEFVEFSAETVDANAQGTARNFSQRGDNLFSCFACYFIAR